MLSTKSITLSAIASFLSLTTASPTIGSLSTPSTVAAGSSIKATLGTSIYVQNWEDYNIVWGIAPAALHVGVGTNNPAIGTQIAYTPLYGTDTEKLNNFTVEVAIPATQPAGAWQLVAAVPYIVSASGQMGINSFVSNITVTAS
ncbi:hypothetical protein F5Y18DRAFT_425756 [Xylariaceae sp. FL1019]|nr:hypothetical protein F5Y18DRAFT_425756 [Xylariaceae sp. FL1019]